MAKRKLQNCGRPKAFWGAIIPAAVSLLGSAIGAYSNAKNQKAAIDAQNEAIRRQNKLNQLNTDAANLNNYFASRQMSDNNKYLVDEYEYSKGGKRKLRNAAVITDGGVATPIDNNTFLLKGNSHSQVNESGNTGIGINVGGKEIEAEGGEVIEDTGNELRIYSNRIKLPRRRYLNRGGNQKLTPAQAVEYGYDKDKVFAAQENYKKSKGLKSEADKASLGAIFRPVDYIGLGTNIAGSLLSGIYANTIYNRLKHNVNYVTPKYYEETPVALNTRFYNGAQRSNVERNRLIGRRNIAENTASANVANQRMQDIDTNAMYQLNELWDTKANKEVELRNANLENIQQVRARNAAARNKWAADVAEIRNKQANSRLAIGEAQLNSNVGMIQGIGNSVGAFLQQGIDAYDADQARRMQLASSPYGTAERAASFGVDFNNDTMKALMNQAKNRMDRYANDTTDEGKQAYRDALDSYQFWQNELGLSSGLDIQPLEKQLLPRGKVSLAKANVYPRLRNIQLGRYFR